MKKRATKYEKKLAVKEGVTFDALIKVAVKNHKPEKKQKTKS